MSIKWIPNEEKGVKGKCPICSGKLIESVLYYNGKVLSPKQIRCQNGSCKGHREPERMQMHIDKIAKIVGTCKPIPRNETAKRR